MRFEAQVTGPVSLSGSVRASSRPPSASALGSLSTVRCRRYSLGPLCSGSYLFFQKAARNQVLAVVLQSRQRASIPCLQTPELGLLEDASHWGL